MKEPLKQVLEHFRSIWDHDGMRPAVRENFKKVLLCRTPALGAEVYASATEQSIVYHTCKSRACPSCGYRATVLWQREQYASLPDMPYREIGFTMPNLLWPSFRDNPALLRDLPAIGGKAIEAWIEAEHGAKVGLMVVPHTFGRHLTFNSHLHILVTAGGLRIGKSAWARRLRIDKDDLANVWRDAVVGYLRLALKQGKLKSSLNPLEMDELLLDQSRRRWVIQIKEFGDRKHFLKYAARYVRHPPIAQYRFVEIGPTDIVFRTQDHKLKKEVLTRHSPSKFIQLLALHVRDRYAHAVRYFGLFAPRTRARTMGAILTLLGQPRRPRPRRLSWALSIEREFGIHPLLDSAGTRMRLIGRRPPTAVLSLERRSGGL